MKVAVMGAGAVGCYYGGMLARAGHQVVLVGRPAHVQAIETRGLWMDLPQGREVVRLQASTEATAAQDAGLVLVCVKSRDSEAAAQQLRPCLAGDAQLLSLQNGVDNAQRLQAELQRPVWPAVVYVAAAMAGPGHVQHHGRGELVLGPAAQQWQSVFQAAGVPVQISDNVAGALWSKLVINCAYNALSAITRMPYGPLVQAEGVWAVMRDVVQECRAVAAAEGVCVPEEVWQQVERIAQTMPGQTSSTAQDLARGKRSEIDQLNGHVLRRGEALGIPTPANRVLHTLVKLLESAAR